MAKGRGNVIITGIGSHKPRYKITNRYLFDNLLSPVPYRQFIRKGLERVLKGKYERILGETIEEIEAADGFGVKERYWEVLPSDADVPVPGYQKRVRASDRKIISSLLNDPANSMFKDGWTYLTEELNLTGKIDPESHTDSAMALNAAKMALYMADIDPERIGAVIHGTATPDALGGYSAAARIACTLGLREDIPVQDFITGCSAAIDALYFAESLLMNPNNDIEAVLITATNFTSGRVKTYFSNKPRNWRVPPGFPGSTSIILFGDGAGSYVVERAKDDDGTGIIHMEKIHRGDYNPAICLEGGSALPITKEAIGFGLEQYFVHHGIVGNHAPDLMCEVAEIATEKARKKGLGDYPPSDADLVIAHQASKNTLNAARDKINIRPDRMVNEVEKRGNLVGASIPIAESIALKRIKRDDILHLLTIGGGWHAGDVIMKIGPEIDKIKKREKDYKGYLDND